MEFLKKETAGLPNGVWLVVIIVGLGIGYFFQNRNQQPAPPTVDTTGDGYQGVGPNAGGLQTYIPPVVTPTSPINWFQTAFGIKPEISEQCGKFLLVIRDTKGSITSTIDLTTIFPPGTVFYGQGAGQAFAVTPGSQTPLLLSDGGYGKPVVDCGNRR